MLIKLEYIGETPFDDFIYNLNNLYLPLDWVMTLIAHKFNLGVRFFNNHEKGKEFTPDQVCNTHSTYLTASDKDLIKIQCLCSDIIAIYIEKHLHIDVISEIFISNYLNYNYDVYSRIIEEDEFVDYIVSNKLTFSLFADILDIYIDLVINKLIFNNLNDFLMNEDFMTAIIENRFNLKYMGATSFDTEIVHDFILIDDTRNM